MSTVILSILGSAGVFSLVQFLITRHDNKHGILEKIRAEIESVKSEIEAMKEERREDRATNARRRILNASDEIRHGVPHSKEWWEQILQDIDEYEKYCDAHEGYRNNRAIMAVENLKKVYSDRLSKNDFLH